jgi:predicted phage baseplate assembly protein
MTTPTADEIIATSTDRRREIRARHDNGLDFAEVHENRRELVLMFLQAAPQRIEPANVRIDGPAGQPALAVTSVRRATNPDPRLRDHLVAQLSHAGGEGLYRITMVEAAPDGRPGTAALRGLDPRFTGCTVRFDVDEPTAAPPSRGPAPTSPSATAPSYLARDYQALRQLLLDGLTKDVPGLTERHVPDVVVALVELFAFLGDDLSYYQDAVATEAYLETARRRTSIRRHARLVGYPFHEGCHARVWIDIQVRSDCELALSDVSFGSETPAGAVVFSPLHAALPPPYTAGETARTQHPRGAAVPLLVAHNQIELWSWGERDSYLPIGATEATLAEPEGHHGPRALRLQPGDLVMFEETVGADGGTPDETHRHTVRLTRVEPATDPLFGRALLEIGWDELDALPFQLPVTTGACAPESVTLASVARANLVLAGQGRRITDRDLDPHATTLHQPDLTWSCPYPDLDHIALHQATLLNDLYRSWRERTTRAQRRARRGVPLNEHERAQLERQFGTDVVAQVGLAGDDECDPTEQAERDAVALWILLARAEDLLEHRIHRLPVLSRLAAASGPLSGPLLAEVRADWGEEVTCGLDAHHPAAWGAAAHATTQDPRRAAPLLRLADAAASDVAPPTSWEVTTGLVDAEPQSARVVVEMQDDRTAALRFNPATEPHAGLVASYLVGNGAPGNVAAETITSHFGGPAAITSVRNPLPATGGRDPQSLEDAKRALPGSQLDHQARALTPADYVRIASAVAGVRNAAAVSSWNAGRITMRVAVQPELGQDPTRALRTRVRHALVTARRIGEDVSVTAPDYCPIVVKLVVELDAYAVRDVVGAEIGALLSSGALLDGRPAFFSPSRNGFGDALHRSALVAAVQEISGVTSVSVAALAFLRPNPGTTVQAGSTLQVSPTAIIRCDNDPAAPENGHAELILMGGR